MMRFLCVFLMLVAGCYAAPAQRTSFAPTTEQKPKSDGEIERALKAKLARSKVGRSNFQVRVQSGVVTLEGATDVVQHKGAATRMARASGARAVVNNIKVSAAGKKKAAAGLEKARKAKVQ